MMFFTMVDWFGPTPPTTSLSQLRCSPVFCVPLCWTYSPERQSFGMYLTILYIYYDEWLDFWWFIHVLKSSSTYGQDVVHGSYDDMVNLSKVQIGLIGPNKMEEFKKDFLTTFVLLFDKYVTLKKKAFKTSTCWDMRVFPEKCTTLRNKTNDRVFTPKSQK